MRKFDPWPVFFRREWNRNWPFLVGFAVTGAIITKFSLGLSGTLKPRPYRFEQLYFYISLQFDDSLLIGHCNELFCAEEDAKNSSFVQRHKKHRTEAARRVKSLMRDDLEGWT
ncbi:hypothetical protein RJ639_033675 [Escallonia herrerae]|uniref:Transmembrane protein n=1 Tax=Escallonia herrerae TaxID=1293975 RepID=A0AA88WW43_9ASTE|nr:hypothetical protein RJ639_033675 [Escallonia herrerae]